MNDHELKSLINKPYRAPGEFYVDDVVTCMEAGRYSCTDVGIRCQVKQVWKRQGKMLVEIMEGPDACEKYEVRAKYFELLEESQA